MGAARGMRHETWHGGGGWEKGTQEPKQVSGQVSGREQDPANKPS